ncbi:MAG: efflux RND transporter permease subunit, partial [Planctomycetales bacterium]|nr:efflux RND transporter permease subunit [Planctomycetales bacterium]
MLSKIIDVSLENRVFVVVLFALIAASGLYCAIMLPVDAVPDMTNVQVVVITQAGALSPLEVEQYVTFVVESKMQGLPDVEEIRSVSKFGLSVVTVVFKDGTDIFRSRQLMTERLVELRGELPEHASDPQLGPIATALGEVLQFEVRGAGYTAMELRTILEWQIAPQLRQVKGVTEINTHGGYYKSFEIQVDPQRLASLQVSLKEILDAISGGNVSTGGGYIERRGEQQFIRGEALFRDETDLKSIVVRTEQGGEPLLLKEIAEVRVAPLTRQGAVTRDGRGEAVTGLVMMLLGENSRLVVERAKEKIAEIEP